MSNLVTIFHAKKTNSKIPLSKFDDNTFIFETYPINTNLEFYNILVSNFILNIPLAKQTEPIRTFRRKTNLSNYYEECVNYFILDLDEVNTEEAKLHLLNFFKEYKVILGASKSYNGINNFNMKGILFADCVEMNDSKSAIKSIAKDLKGICKIDEAVTRKATLNAPILKNEVFLNNEHGKLYTYSKETEHERTEEVKSEYTYDGIVINIDELNGLIDEDIDCIEKLCLKVFQSMNFTAIKNNSNGSITFKHPNEKKSVGGYFWFSSSPYTMHHANPNRTINIFDTVRKLDAAKELLQKNINYDSEFLNFDTNTNIINVNEKYLSVTPEISDVIQKFLIEKDGLLSIRSPMGTGKSTIINNIIEECHDEDMRVLIVTNRISVAKDFGKKYSIKVYNQDKYIYGDSLVCQFDSLWKYDIKNFDIIIMDEFISLMTHSRSNLNNNSINIAKFFACFNRKLVIADAFLTGYENFLLSNKKSNIHLIDNEYRDKTVLYNYSNYNYFVDSIMYHSTKNKITVSATSLQFINSLQMLLQKKVLK